MMEVQAARAFVRSSLLTLRFNTASSEEVTKIFRTPARPAGRRLEKDAVGPGVGYRWWIRCLTILYLPDFFKEKLILAAEKTGRGAPPRARPKARDGRPGGSRKIGVKDWPKLKFGKILTVFEALWFVPVALKPEHSVEKRK
jgi:hypothetical protein